MFAKNPSGTGLVVKGQVFERQLALVPEGRAYGTSSTQLHALTTCQMACESAVSGASTPHKAAR